MNQKEQVLTYLQIFESITPLEALRELSVYRLSDVIFKLRVVHDIETEQEQSVNRFDETVRYAKYIYKGIKK